MKKYFMIASPFLLIAALAPASSSPAVAQQDEHAHSDSVMTGGGEFPEGWHARVDGDEPADGVVFVTMGEGFHATTGPAAVFYNTDWNLSGDYEFAARFTQTKAPAHPEAYGIVVGGTDLSGADQAYSYFLVRNTGEYFIANRTGDERTVVVNWTKHEAVKEQDENGRQINLLGARVEGDDVVFTSNGVEVDRRPRSEIHSDGLAGFRINHRLDVHIDPVHP